MRRASKLLITMLTLTVLFAVFAISASAADYSGTLSGDIVLNDGDTIGADGSVTILADTTITVNGTVTVKNIINIGNDDVTDVDVTISGTDNKKDILVADSAYATSNNRMITVRGANLTVANVTIDANSVGVQNIMGYNNSSYITLNSGASLVGSTNGGGAIFGYGQITINEGASVVSESSLALGLDGGSNVYLKGGTVEGGTYAINFRKSTCHFHYYSGSVSGAEGVWKLQNSSAKDSFIVYQTWATAEDPSYDSTDWTENKWWDVATEYVVEVTANIDATAGITISAGPTITIVGKNLGTAETPVYPTLKNMSTSAVSIAFVNISASAKLVLENITIDANGYTGDIAGTPTKNTQGTRVAFLNTGAALTLNNGTILKNGYSSSPGGCVATGTSLSVSAELTMNEGSMITGGYCSSSTGGGAVCVQGASIFTMNGGTISGNRGQNGGGVALNNGTFIMNGGDILDNISNNMGGGVYAAGSGLFTMNGGTVSGNTAKNGAAVITRGTAHAELIGGTVEKNKDIDTATKGNAGVQNSQGSMTVHDTLVFGTNYNSDGTTAGLNVIPGGSGTTISLVFHYNKDNASELVNWADKVIGGDTTVGVAASAPWSKASKAGTLTLLIDGELNSGALNITDGANIIIKGKNGTADKLCYVGNTSNRAVSVRAGGTLTVENITITAEKSTAEGTRGLVVESGATLNINDGAVITGGFGVSGAGIYNQGVVVMNGGSITGNKAKGGAGAVNNNGSAASFTMLGGSISGNTATEEGAGVYTFKGAAFVIGGDAVVNGNTTDGIESNVCIQVNENYTSSATINADFTGSVGFHAEYDYADTTLVLGTVVEGAAGTVTSDEKNVTLTIADGSATLTFTAEDITISSPNNTTVAVSSVARGAYKLPEPTAPAGYDADDFIGYVVVSGYGTVEAKAEKILAAGTMISSDDLAKAYATWVKVNTLTGASAQISENSGIRFFTTINDADLAAVGIKVKAGSAEGDGYYRGTLLGTSATDLTEALSKDNYKMDVKVNNTGWANAAAYGVVIDEGLSSFAVSITYGSENYYNNAVAYRGYIEITVGETSVVVYSDFTNPGTLTDSADATYGDVHARSACAIVRNVYFTGAYSEEALIEELGEANYAIALKIAGYDSFPA